MFGLTHDELKQIVEILRQEPQIQEAIIFGSRAMNTHKRGSDIDIALKGKNINLTKISGTLNEESSFPYVFDLINFDSIVNQDLKNHIERVGKRIFPAT